METVIEEKDKELHSKDRQIQEQHHTIQLKERQLQEKCSQLLEKDKLYALLNGKDHALDHKVKEIQDKQKDSEQDFQCRLQQKDMAIAELQKTKSAQERMIIWRLEKQHTACASQKPETASQTSLAVVESKGISKMWWRKGKNAPEAMMSGMAVVSGNAAYFRPASSSNVYCLLITSREEQWSRLPGNPSQGFGLAVIDDLLTSVGGWKNGSINTLLSLREKTSWSEVIPPMPTPRSEAVCITTKSALVVAGGCVKHYEPTDIVEVIDLQTKQWIEALLLPKKCRSLSAAVCGNTLYLAGGVTGFVSRGGIINHTPLK